MHPMQVEASLVDLQRPQQQLPRPEDHEEDTRTVLQAVLLVKVHTLVEVHQAAHTSHQTDKVHDKIVDLEVEELDVVDDRGETPSFP